jgi:hypothetical protein
MFAAEILIRMAVVRSDDRAPAVSISVIGLYNTLTKTTRTSRSSTDSTGNEA